MACELESGLTGRRKAVPTPDELVVHLREARAKRVYLSRSNAFYDGVIPLIATYEYTPEETARESESEAVRKMLRRVFDAIGDQLWFYDREWSLDWRVEPAFTDSQADLLPLYDRGVEQKHGDGFNLRNLLFAYEAYREQNIDS